MKLENRVKHIKMRPKTIYYWILAFLRVGCFCNEIRLWMNFAWNWRNLEQPRKFERFDEHSDDVWQLPTTWNRQKWAYRDGVSAWKRCTIQAQMSKSKSDVYKESKILILWNYLSRISLVFFKVARWFKVIKKSFIV